MTTRRPEFAVLGAGAIGSILGAHLARAGHSVVMLARGRRAAQVREAGLHLTGLSDFHVQVPVLEDASQLAGADVLIVAMKTMGTREALEPLRSAQVGAAFSIQNGLWKNDQLVQVFGADKVLGSLANTSGELLASGEVLFTRNVNVLVGELAGGDSARAQRIAATIDAAGVRAAAVPDMLAREWTKFVGWVGLMSMAVTTRCVTWEYLGHADCATVLVRLVREMLQLARASGIRLGDEKSLLPLRVIMEGTESQAIAAVMEAGGHFKRDAPEHRMSALQDLEAGRALEVDETLGDAVRRARALNLSLPLLEAIYHLVAALDRTARASAAPKPAGILA